MNSVYLALTGESVGHLTVSSKAVKRYFSKRMKSCHSYRYGHIKRFYYSWGNLQMLKRIQKKTKECWAGILKEVCNWKQDWFYCIVCVCVGGGGSDSWTSAGQRILSCICDLIAWILEPASDRPTTTAGGALPPTCGKGSAQSWAPPLLYECDHLSNVPIQEELLPEPGRGLQSLIHWLTHSQLREPMLLLSANVTKVFGSMGVLQTPLSFCHCELKVSVGYLKG